MNIYKYFVMLYNQLISICKDNNKSALIVSFTNKKNFRLTLINQYTRTKPKTSSLNDVNDNEQSRRLRHHEQRTSSEVRELLPLGARIGHDGNILTTTKPTNCIIVHIHVVLYLFLLFLSTILRIL